MFSTERPAEEVALLRMDDGKVNAIGPAFVDAFPKALQQAAQAGDALVLAGNEKAFSAGLDLKVLPELDPDELATFFARFNASMRALLAHPGPVVAAVQGPAIAGGAVLALCCDLRLAGPRATLGLTEVRVAVPFPPPVLALARDRLPADEHAPALLQGVLRQGGACLERGWVHEQPDGDIEVAAVERAGELGASNAATFQATKALVNRDLVAAVDRFEDSMEGFLEHFQAPGAMEAIQQGFERMRSGR